MNKKILIPILIIILFRGVIYGVTAFKNKKNGNSLFGSSIKKELGNQSKSTLQSLLGAGKKIKCTWKHSDESLSMEGTVYIDDKKSKMEMKMQIKDQSATEQMPKTTIYTYTDGEWVYSWGGFSDHGTKFRIDEMEKQVAETSNNDNDDTKSEIMNNWEQEFEYDCKPWKVDNSIFQLPTNIQFIDLEEEVKQLKEQMGGMADMCDNLPEPQKSECIKALTQ